MNPQPADDAAAPIIRIENMGKTYHAGEAGEVCALRGVSLRIAAGEFVAIMGPSGSGKSTLMNLIGCLDTPSSGRYWCAQVDVAQLDAAARARLRLQQIGFVFQGFHLLPRQSALENVMLPLVYAGVPRAQRLLQGQAALAQVGLSERASHRPTELSGGQQQRVAIARALINRPAIILADEPTGALDSHTGEEILALFKALQREGHTIVLITHDPKVAQHADRICRMHDGELNEIVDASGAQP